jgi:hypothetical protein
MKSWVFRFNTYLLIGGLAAGLGAWAAETQKKPPARQSGASSKTNALLNATNQAGLATKDDRSRRKESSTFRAFVETADDGTQRCIKVPVDRVLPIKVTIDRNAALFEEHVARASVVDVLGGCAIKVVFNERGTIVLDSLTTTYRGQRLVIFSNFGTDRWLAAPMMTRRIADGVLVFTPDATRDEAERMVNGLNNVVAKLIKRSMF